MSSIAKLQTVQKQLEVRNPNFCMVLEDFHCRKNNFDLHNVPIFGKFVYFNSIFEQYYRNFTKNKPNVYV